MYDGVDEETGEPKALNLNKQAKKIIYNSQTDTIDIWVPDGKGLPVNKFRSKSIENASEEVEKISLLENIKPGGAAAKGGKKKKSKKRKRKKKRINKTKRKKRRNRKKRTRRK